MNGSSDLKFQLKDTTKTMNGLNENDKSKNSEDTCVNLLDPNNKKRFNLVKLVKELKLLEPNFKLFENSIQGSDDFLKYTDKSFDVYIDDQIKMTKFQKGIKSKTKFLTYEVAKYFLAKIPNNYFDAMQIVNLTSELIYESPQITEWTEDDVIKWFDSLGLNGYSNIIKENNVNGMTLLKLNIHEYKDVLKIQDTKDIKLLMKSIDFLRIFVKLKLDFHDYLEYERNEREKNENLMFATQPPVNTLKDKEIFNNLNINQTTNTTRNLTSEKIYFGEEIMRKDKSSKESICDFN